MPAKDRYHDVVIRALAKVGWHVTAEQVAIVTAERRLWIDLQVAKASERLVILIEVKGFENMSSPWPIWPRPSANISCIAAP